MLNWERMFRRYVYDAEKTPYFTATAKLTKVQAANEIFVYALFTGVIFAIVGVASLSGRFPHGDLVVVPIYAFATAAAAVMFAFTKESWASACCIVAPLAVLIYCAVFGFHPRLGFYDKALIIAALLGWLAYGWRIFLITFYYPDMPDGTRRTGRRTPFDSLDDR